MTYIKYNTTDNAVGQLNVGIGASTTTIQLNSGEGAKFATTNQIIRLVQYNTPADTTSGLAKSENVLLINRSGDTLTVTRGQFSSTATDFLASDYIYGVNNSEVIKDLQDEITRLEDDKAEDNEVVKKTGSQTIGGIKTFSSSPIIPTPTTNSQATNKSYVDTSIQSASSSFLHSVGIAHENITAGDIVGFTGEENKVVSSGTGLGYSGIGSLRYSNTYYRAGQQFELSTSTKITSVGVRLVKSGTGGTGSIFCKVYQSNKTTLIETSTTTRLGSEVYTGGGRFLEFAFSSVLPAGTYFFELSSTSVVSTINYVSLMFYNPGNYAFSASEIENSSGTWSTPQPAYDYDFIIKGSESNDGTAKVKKQLSESNSVLGISNTNYNSGEAVSSFVGGVVGGFSGLTVGKIYKTSTTTAGDIEIGEGTYMELLAINSTSVLIIRST